MNRTLIFIIAFLLSCFFCAGQQNLSPLSFEHSEWDFGKAKEDGGVLTHEYPFINTGKTPVRITTVETYCKCTKADYPHAPIAPGEKGVIRVTFDPYGYNGQVSRGVSVLTDMGSKDKLNFTTQLTPRVKPVEEEYPILISPGLRIEKTVLDFGVLRSGESKTVSLRVVNVSDESLSLTLSGSLPFIAINCPKTISPLQKMDIPLVCSNAKDVGISADSLRLEVNKSSFFGSLFSSATELKIAVKITITESFGSLPEGKSGPAAAVTSNYTNFGKISRGAVPVTKQYVLANRGDAPLIVRDISCPSGITTTLPVGTTVPPGETCNFTVTLDPSAFPLGSVFELMRVLFNDPTTPARDLMIAARIL